MAEMVMNGTDRTHRVLNLSPALLVSLQTAGVGARLPADGCFWHQPWAGAGAAGGAGLGQHPASALHRLQTEL